MSPLQWSLIFFVAFSSTIQAHKVDINQYLNLTYVLPEDCHKHGADKCPYRQPFGFFLINNSLPCPAIFENIDMERSEVLTDLSTDLCVEHINRPTIPGYLTHTLRVCIYCDDKLHMRCHYHTPQKCESIEDVLDFDKGGHCSNCQTTRLGTGGFHGVAHIKAVPQIDGIARRNKGRDLPSKDIEIHKWAEIVNPIHDGGYWLNGERAFPEMDNYEKLAVEAKMNYKHLRGRQRRASKAKVEQEVRKMGSGRNSM